MKQASLRLSGTAVRPYPFAGATYRAARDGARLTRQLDAVAALMRDGQWRTLRAIAAQVGGSETAVSARLRDLRKPAFGALVVERRYWQEGRWLYRVTERPV